jgi:hypothetical protein
MTDTMRGFGYKTAWLAVRVDGADETRREEASDFVFASLGAKPRKDVDWLSGLDRSYVSDEWLVATPLLPGTQNSHWLLVVGRRLLLREDQVDPVGLSIVLDTEVQYFGTHRVVEYHRWTRAVRGILVRSFAYLGEAGEVKTWIGDPDNTELAIGLPPAEPGSDHSLVIGEDDVMRVARAWSVDPTSLEGQPATGPLRLAVAHDAGW